MYSFVLALGGEWLLGVVSGALSLLVGLFLILFASDVWYSVFDVIGVVVCILYWVQGMAPCRIMM